MPLLKAPRLRKGDLIALIAPASTPPNQDRVDGGVRYLESRGYNVVVGTHAMEVHGYLAGTDEARLEDLNGFLHDKRVRAIIAIRGGYGTPRMLRDVDYDALRRDPKVIVGYSDLTGLQLAILAKTGLITFSGPMAGVEMWKEIDSYTEENFWRMVESTHPPGLLLNPPDEPILTLKEGEGRGPLVGGNLSLVASLVGTPYLPSVRDAMLVAEDVDEAPHRVDRMFAQLANAGALNSAAGLLLGKFTDCVPTDPEKPHFTVDRVLADAASQVRGPVVANLQYGHIPKKLTIPLGALCRVETRRGVIEVLEGAVE